MHLFQDLIPALIATPWVILVVAAVCVLDGFFPPVPSETTVVAVLASVIAIGESTVWAVAIAAAAALGAIAGDSIAYALGRRFGIDRIRWFRGPKAQRVIGSVSSRVHSSSASLILVGRYIPGGRVVVNMLAGASGLRYRRFAAFSVIAGISWAAMCATVATMSAAWLGDPLWSALLGIGVMLAIGLVIDLVAKRRERARQENSAKPILT